MAPQDKFKDHPCILLFILSGMLDIGCPIVGTLTTGNAFYAVVQTAKMSFAEC
jgi:hypothetical protein